MNEISVTLDCELCALEDHVLSLLNPQCLPQGLAFRTQKVEVKSMNIGLLRMGERRYIFACIGPYFFPKYTASARQEWFLLGKTWHLSSESSSHVCPSWLIL